MTIANRTKSIETTFKKIEPEGSLVILENTRGYERRCIEFNRPGKRPKQICRIRKH